MKKTTRKSILIIAYSILLCVTISFAWILAVEPNVVQNVNINYDDDDQLIIAPSDIEGQIIVTNGNGEEVQLDENFSIQSNEIIPNSVVPFKIRLRNNTELATKIDLSIVGIEVSNEKILNVVYFSATPSSGWTTNVPLSVYKQFGDAQKGTVNDRYSMKVMEEITLRPTDTNNEQDCLEFSCYLYFDGETMTNEHKNITLSLGAFRITQK